MVAFQRVDTIACHNVLITRLDKVAHENSQLLMRTVSIMLRSANF
jgi:hypothetical protein